MSSINILPKELTSVRTVVRARVYVKSIELFQRVVVGVEYCDTLGILFDGPTFVIAGDDYLQWASDDNYIINYAYQQIGITVAPAPAPDASQDASPHASPHASQEPAPVSEPAASQDASPDASQEPAPVSEPAASPDASQEPAPDASQAPDTPQ